ncbi:TPM domain-containing protein [Cytophagaceae bacterium YF14B1]|uniref:TPM domain-containing protein n=1 Tax=Xanthocytophaga flava TaxID=3048013 RepID=A0AAE3U449_9BACT|nr:TPM domain-containing protein [Xanthocytophaga flavus]MDJ1479414.1 TPM domain-containing protein [Xanthocytophaga flavus]
MALLSFLSSKEERLLVEAIQKAEGQTSGEIRVHIEPGTPDADPFQRALEIFARLEMHKTKQRNGVLFYIATDTHKFAIVADSGINRVAPENFWEEIKHTMRTHFKQHQYLKGLEEGITQTGEYLKKYFPSSGYDTNELDDSISTSS